MKTMFAIAAIACVVVTGPARAQSPPSPAQRQIQPLLDEMLQAANAHDTDRFLTPYLHDSTLAFVFNGMVMNGFTAVRDAQLKAWNNGKSDVVYSVRGPTSYQVLTPSIALATLPLTSRRTLPTGEAKTTEMTVTMVWQKRAAGWRIVQVHESTVR